VNKEIAKYIDVMIGNEEDFTAALGFEVEGNDENLKELNLDGYKKMIHEVVAALPPNFRVIATTLRTVHSAPLTFGAQFAGQTGKYTRLNDYGRLEIMDRVGGGDSFASVWSMPDGNGDPAKAVNYGAAHGALAMTTPGDTSMANVKEVEKLMSGGMREGCQITRHMKAPQKKR
jgi:2-dehydro-3-deoxygluconokinase